MIQQTYHLQFLSQVVPFADTLKNSPIQSLVSRRTMSADKYNVESAGRNWVRLSLYIELKY